MHSLNALSYKELRELHLRGTCPQADAFNGVADGQILGGGLLSRLKIWRGKAFEMQTNGVPQGLNRIGVGPWEFRKYRFTAYVGRSAFSQRDVLLLDHDHDGNPAWVRSYHDELVQVGDNLYLATSHQKVNGKLAFRAYFCLSLIQS